ncbi:hypothetical protein FKM82_020202 [Ascaphus truei]
MCMLGSECLCVEVYVHEDQSCLCVEVYVHAWIRAACVERYMCMLGSELLVCVRYMCMLGSELRVCRGICACLDQSCLCVEVYVHAWIRAACV